MESAQAGHDAPVSQRGLDDYDRWPLAEAISNTIQTSPPEWSTRIAVYGRWGEGKTTLVNFLSQMQAQAGNVVITFKAWNVSGEEDLWEGFVETLRIGFQRAGIRTGMAGAVLGGLKRVGNYAGAIVKGGAKTAEVLYRVSVPDPIVDAATGKIRKLLTFSSKDALRIVEQLGDKRAVVIIDDLDRADPNVVPRLLLTLREVLDLPRFVFVLAFDRTVISKSLEQHNEAWGPNAEVFLEKIVDFPFDLPPPTLEQTEKLAIRQFGKICPFVPAEDLRKVLKVMPQNPRKLKLVARTIGALTKEVRRHADGELRWEVILLYYLMKAESDEFARAFVKRVLGDNEFSWVRWARDEGDGEHEDGRLAAFIDVDHKHLSPDVRERLKSITTEWRQRSRALIGTSLEYQISFAVNPHHITWKEFETFFAEWRNENTEARAISFVASRVQARASSRDLAAAEFMEAITGHYSKVLERASGVRSAREHRELIQQAEEALGLFEQCYFGSLGNDIRSVRTVAVWRSLLGPAFTWIGFRNNPGEDDLRNREAAVLTRLAEGSPAPVEFYNALSPWESDWPAIDRRTREHREALQKRLQTALTPAVAEVALDTFAKRDGFTNISAADDHHLALRYVLFSVDSPLYQAPYLARLEALLRRGQEEFDIHRNAWRYLELLLGALKHEGRFCTRDQRLEFLRSHTELVRTLWATVVAFRSQYRFLSGTREMRQELITAGVEEATVPAPDWLNAS